MRRKIAIFEVLGVSPEDDISTIRRAWRNKVRELHPDVAVDKDAAGEKLARINAAFNDLKSHTPFTERRTRNRRKARRSNRPWSSTERSETLGKRARRTAEAARRRARAAAAARKQQEAARKRAEMKEAARKKAAQRQAEHKAANHEAPRPTRAFSKIRPKLSQKQKAAHLISLKGYAAALGVVAADADRGQLNQTRI